MGSYEPWALQSLAHLSPPPFELKFDSVSPAKMASLASLYRGPPWRSARLKLFCLKTEPVTAPFETTTFASPPKIAKSHLLQHSTNGANATYIYYSKVDLYTIEVALQGYSVDILLWLISRRV